MTTWEFLIQKEGDRSWLPLESPTVEILEGRYRMVARSQFPNTPVEVEISHQYEVDGLWKRGVQQRSQQTNQEGLLGVIPFTYLQPGFWKILCRNLPTASETASWQQSIQLQVLTQEAELWSDWETLERPDQDRAEFMVEPTAMADGRSETLAPTEPLPAIAAQQPLQPQVSPSPSLGQLSFELVKPIPVSEPCLVGGSAAGEHPPATQPKSLGLELPCFRSSRPPLKLRRVSSGGLPPRIRKDPPRPRSQGPELPVLPRTQTPANSGPVANSLKTGTLNQSSHRVDAAFEALKLKNRFWSTLNLLAREVDLKEVLAQSSPMLSQTPPSNLAVPPATVPPSAPTTATPEAGTASPPQIDFAAFTLAACPPPAPEMPQAALHLPEWSLNPEDQQLPLFQLRPDASLPAPTLTLTPATLIAGEAVTVGISLPAGSPQILVKLWLSDRLTEQMLEGPRWLVDFRPNPATGLLETSTQIFLPPKTTEITLGAIAVDWQTQQESLPLTLNRSVALPQPPVSQDFEI